MANAVVKINFANYEGFQYHIEKVSRAILTNDLGAYGGERSYTFAHSRFMNLRSTDYAEKFNMMIPASIPAKAFQVSRWLMYAIRIRKIRQEAITLLENMNAEEYTRFVLEKSYAEGINSFEDMCSYMNGVGKSVTLPIV